MKELVSIADIITPNITEASLLTNIDYKINFSEEEVNIIKNKLIEIGAKNIIITGITSKNKIGISYGNEDNTSFYYHKMIKGPIHGTGDVYLGAFTGAYLNNKTFEEANLIAAHFGFTGSIITFPNSTKLTLISSGLFALSTTVSIVFTIVPSFR